MFARPMTEPMTADTFMAWYDTQPDGPRFELLDGVPYETAREPLIHTRIKSRIVDQLSRQIETEALACEAFVGGMSVRIDETSVFEPDAFVHCGRRLHNETAIVDDPMIVVEIATPPTQRIDPTIKLARYFRIPHIIHYLIVVPLARTLIHHRRAATGTIVTSIHTEKTLVFDPPGLSVSVEGLFLAA